jgi:hypothetical protein
MTRPPARKGKRRSGMPAPLEPTPLATPAGGALVSNSLREGAVLHGPRRVSLLVQLRAREHIAVCNSHAHADWYHRHITRPPSRSD